VTDFWASGGPAKAPPTASAIKQGFMRVVSVDLKV